MNIAYLINQYPQPSQSFIRREIRMLEELGRKVMRITVRRWDGRLVDPGDIAERDQTLAILEHKTSLITAPLRALLTRPAKLFSALSAAVRMGRRSHRGVLTHLIYLAEACVLQSWLKRESITHVHAHFGTNSAAVVMLCRLVGGPEYSFTVHGPEEFDSPYALSLGEKVAHAKFVVVIGHFGQSQLYRWASFSNWPKIHLVRCGLDAAFLDELPQRSPQPGRLVCVARLGEQKGQIVLIEAAKLLRDRGVKFELRLVGDGELRPVIEERVAAYGLSNEVKLLGWKSSTEVRNEIEESSAMVLPSFAEGLPVVIMESLARHRPVISTYVAAIPELVVPGVSGWLVPPGDSEKLADAMQQAIETGDQSLIEMGRRGAELVRNSHSARTEAGKLKKLIEG